MKSEDETPMTKAPVQTERLLARFLRYVQVDTTAREDAVGYPSSAGQLELGRLLMAELKEIGLKDVSQSAEGIVMATLPATGSEVGTRPGKPCVIAFNSHLDTSPETSGTGVKPQVIRNYQGGDLALPGDARQVIRQADNPDLAQCLGHTLITTDGTTLLGADDKAGIAVIMETAAYLAEHPEIPHGPIKVCFTCDEEVGHGVDHVDLKQLGGTVCYTLDGQGRDEVDVETFSADLAIIRVQGCNIHPSIGKGRMVNAVRVASHFVDLLPQAECSPETTDGREGFLHPYHIDGSVAEATIRILLRDFDTAHLTVLAERLRQIGLECEKQFPRSSVEVTIQPQYRNMADGLRQEPRAVALAQQALERLGRQPRLTLVRGGTDGSRFTELGLPTPNLSTGQHNPHSPLEWASLDEMVAAVEMLVQLAQLWAAERE
jgi:tripeptide aminopeptidase